MGAVTDQQRAPAEGAPGRYQRSLAGGIGSLIVLVLAVLAFVGFRAVFRDNDAVDVEPVDYLAVVGPAQQSGMRVIYPPSLPRGWKATSVHFDPGDPPAWGVGMLTGEGKFVGVRQQDSELDGLLADAGLDDPAEGDLQQVQSPIATKWQEWSDADGDHAYTAEVGDYEVLVYGSAATDDLLTVVRSLTDVALD